MMVRVLLIVVVIAMMVAVGRGPCLLVRIRSQMQGGFNLFQLSEWLSVCRHGGDAQKCHQNWKEFLYH